jgi:ferredoxin
MKESTKVMFQKHGWRVDRFVHNYYYFLFYYPYVAILHKLVLLLKYLAWFKPIVPVGKMIFNRYHSIVLAYDDNRKISQEEAMEIIERFRKKKHITQAFFKVATGGSTGVICNCHPDTCVSLQATNLAGKISNQLSMTAKSGYSVAVDEDKCIACGNCADMCGFEAMTFIDGQRMYKKELCMGCELCVENCPENALSLYIDSAKPLPLDLDQIKSQAATAI